MLPVINEMEQKPFKHKDESHFNGVRYTLRNGFLQSQCVANNNNNNHNHNHNNMPSMPSPSSDTESNPANNSLNNIINHAHSDINNIKNLSIWVCTGNKKSCQQFRSKLLHRNPSQVMKKQDFDENGEDKKISGGVVEIPLNLNNVLIPFMSSLANGSQNTNLYFNVYAKESSKDATDNKVQLRFLPLDSLPIQNQINTKRLSFKVLSCGTFKRNLQPMVGIFYIFLILTAPIFFIHEDIYNIIVRRQ